MIAIGVIVDPRRAAKLTHHDYQRGVEQPALVQIVEQRGE